ncbi:hypothetical protein ACIPL1_04150 [Pseudomonas sp. NPDC090202]|uniref:hypothetical protein n=1 Tax=unclassified Pseudomonas TaxID=196821 RepID=UPI003810E0A5
MPHLETVNSTPLRGDVWSTANRPCRSRYQILAEAQPDLICRVLNLFAMQYLIPQQVSVLQQEGMLMLEIEVGEMSWHRAQTIGQKMRNLVDVCSVELEPIDDLHVLSGPVSLAVG